MAAFTLEDIPDDIAAVLPPSPHLHAPTQGMTSDVMVATNGNQSVVVKRCGHPIYLNWLRREQHNLHLLKHCGLPVPTLLHYDELLGTSGLEGWLVMTHLPGRSFWDVVLEIAAPGRAPLLFRLGQLLRQLHSTPVPTAIHRNRAWLTRKLEEAKENLPWCDGSAALLEKLNLTVPSATPEVLVHGDMSLDNVLIDDTGKLSLVDCSGVDSGDARYDLALALNAEPETTYVTEEIEAFYAGYGSPKIDNATRRWFLDLYEFF